MANMPANYFNRFDAGQNYDEHLFVAGRGLQSAELNEIQSRAANIIKGVADALFSDGDIIRDASVSVNEFTGDVQCAPGAIYLRGSVRGVPPAEFTIPVVGVVAIGVRLVETVVTAVEDPGLLDPATGTRNYNMPGADRLQVEPQWGWDGDGVDGEFYPIYGVTDGLLNAKEPPPSIDLVTQALARYDRDSAGGTYVVQGLDVKALDDLENGTQVYSLAEGRARVYGYGMEFATSRRVLHAAVPDLLEINNEPFVSTTVGAQRVNFARTPGTFPSDVSITAEKTVTLTHGVFTGAQDPLPDTSVLAIIEVKQGGTTYTPTTDYLLTSGKVDWSPAGSEPAPGSTYTVKYQYITIVTPTAVDDNGFTVTGALAGTLILTTYGQKLPRIDRLCISTAGAPVWLVGVAAAFYPQPPSVPADLLPIASVYQTWTLPRRVTNDGVRVVPMPILAGIEGRMDYVLQLIAQQRLESSIHTREGGTKKGLFTDPFLDDSQRDAGTPQTAAIVRGILTLPIAATINQMGADITSPQTLSYNSVITLEQVLRTGGMNINPYMAFGLDPARVTLTPSVDRWTVTDNVWLSNSTARFVVGSGDQSSATTSTRSVLIGSSNSAIETLRQITVSYSVAGFGPGEALQALTFDGVSLPTGGATANGAGVLSGSFVIPANVPAGNKRVVLTGSAGMSGEAVFSGQGTLERQTWQQQTTVTETRWQSPPPPPPVQPRFVDPLAQTFTLTETVQVSAIDLWFTAASTTATTVQIRETATGLPTQNIVAEATIQPASILTGGASTRISFLSPVNLLAGNEYAIVVLCNDPIGALSVAELGKFDATNQRWITSQPYTVGVLLSSSNASTWTPHQDRDMAFRILRASYTETQRTINLGDVPVVGATDLLLMAYAERPASATGVEYVMTLPGGDVVTVSDGQPVQLAAAITGDVNIAAKLIGTPVASPVMYPGAQLVAGIIATTGDYVSRAIPAGTSVQAKVIYEAVVPSGATIGVFYKGPDAGDTWTSMPVSSTRQVDDGFVEFIHAASGITEVTVQIKLVLNGTPAARPRVRDLRALVI
jgi:hypothetical protein